jgi:N-acetylmuramic acid 6-phosphate etherase
MTPPDPRTTATPPLDRGHLSTEQRLAASAALDALSIEQTLRLINTQDMDVPRIVRDVIPNLMKLVHDIVAGMRQGGRLIYVGAGTSGRLGVLDASECPPTFHTDPAQVVGLIAGGDPALRRSSEGREDQTDGAHAELDQLTLTAHDTVVGIAAGGTTPYVWGALAKSKKHGATTALICCVPLKSLMHRPRAAVVPANAPTPTPPSASLPAQVDHAIELVVGPEVVTGSTRMKAGTATKLALNMISTTVMIQLGKTWGNLMVDLRATNAKLRDRALRMITSQCNVDRDHAEHLLDAADGKVKLALVMARLNIEKLEAQNLLEQHQGHLRPILGPPR